MLIHIYGSDARITLNVIARQYPEATDYWDANWYRTRIEAEVTGFQASFTNDIHLPELLAWRNELQFMHTHLFGSASLVTIEDFLKIDTDMNQLGKLLWNVTLRNPVACEKTAELQFEFVSDQSYLPPVIEQLNSVFTKFPVIGKP